MSKILDMWAGMTGTVLDFAGSTAPPDWLMCYGQAVSRTTYANLFAKIGGQFGVGDGSTTFNLPDARGRVLAGKDDMGGLPSGRLTNPVSGVNATTLGAAGGSQSHTLDASQMPVHSHGIIDPGHSHSQGGVALWFTDPDKDLIIDGTGVAGVDIGLGTSTNVFSSAVTGISMSTAGLGGAHTNTQPTLVLNKIIKT